MRRRHFTSFCIALFCTVFLTVSCGSPSQINDDSSGADVPPTIGEATIVLGYSNWPGWWPWAIAEKEGLFQANGVNVEMRWFDSYVESMEALAAGSIDGNSQTLGDTISFASDAVHGEVAVLVNDNSDGNDKIIVSEYINSIEDLQSRRVAIEEGVVDDFLLTLALEDAGMLREDVEIIPLETSAAAEAFVAGEVDAVGAFPPFWLTALERPGSKELLSSADYPGAIPDLLVVTKKLRDGQPEAVKAIVKTWFDTLAFMEANPERSDEIMAERAGISIEELSQLQAGTRMFSLRDNIKAFAPGKSLWHMSNTAKRISEFMVDIGFIPEAPPLDDLLDDQFIKAYEVSLD